MKNCITLILLFISLFSFSQCENDSINPYFVNFEHVFFDVEIGSMLLFPSWLKHGSNYEKNKSKSIAVLEPSPNESSRSC